MDERSMDAMQNASALSAKEAFRRRLSELMQGRQTKQKELAEVLGIRAQTVSQYITGRTTPDYDILRQIAQYYGVTLDWLLGVSEYQSREMEQMSVLELGISQDAIDVWMEEKPFSDETSNERFLSGLNKILCDEEFYSFCTLLGDVRDQMEKQRVLSSDLIEEECEQKDCVILRGLSLLRYRNTVLEGMARKIIKNATGLSDLEQRTQDAMHSIFERLDKGEFSGGFDYVSKLLTSLDRYGIDAIPLPKEKEDHEQHH